MKLGQRSAADVQIGLDARVGRGPAVRLRGRAGIRAEAGLT
jgi:hypothetical protein